MQNSRGGAMKQSDGITKRVFSKGVHFLVQKSGYSQRQLARQCGVSPSSLNDYIIGRREGSEDVRRRITAVLGYPYEGVLALGQLIDKGFDPEQWEAANSKVSKDLRVYQRPNKEGRPDVLLVPPLWKQDEDEVEIVKKAYIDDYAPQADIHFIKVYPSILDGNAQWPDVGPVDTIPVRPAWVERLGGSSTLAAFRALDDLTAPIVVAGDLVMCRTNTHDNIIAGRFYVVQLPDDPTIYVRKLMRTGVNIRVTETGDVLPIEDVIIIGEVVWVGHEL